MVATGQAQLFPDGNGQDHLALSGQECRHVGKSYQSQLLNATHNIYGLPPPRQIFQRMTLRGVLGWSDAV